MCMCEGHVAVKIVCFVVVPERGSGFNDRTDARYPVLQLWYRSAELRGEHRCNINSIGENLH